ncbi:MAG: ABC transporter permease [Acidobacteriota bacterium]
MYSVQQDLRFALRVIRKQPVTNTVIVLTLALGIGANVGMFAGFDAWVLRPLDFDRPEALVTIEGSLPKLGESGMPVSAANLRDWQDESRSFEKISAYHHETFNFHHRDDPDRVRGARIDVALFPLLGKAPILGRNFSPDEATPGAADVALISYQLWQNRFAGDADAVGRTFRLDGRPHELVGVMPEGFEFPGWEHIWTPLRLPADGGPRAERTLSTVARLAPGVGAAEAQAEMTAIAARLATQYPVANAGRGVEIAPLRDRWSPPVIRLALTVSLVAAAAVLLVICANVANLLLAQATTRRQELALRTALGASRGRLVRQTVTEGLLLALGGGVLGAVIGGWWVDWMLYWAPVDPPYLFRFNIDGRAFAYTLALAMLAGLACALAPVLRSSGLDVSDSLKSGGSRSVSGAKSQRLPRLLVVGELAASVLLLIGALLMVKSFLREQQIDPGYRADGVLTLRMSFAGTDYEEPADRAAVVDRILAQVESLGGVESAGVANRLPVGSGGVVGVRLEAEGRPVERGEEPRAAYHSVTRDYLGTLELPLVSGRRFTDGEVAQGGEVAVVSRSLADLLWPGQDPLGRRLRLVADEKKTWRRVVGVVGDVDPGHNMVQSNWPRTQFYVPYGEDSDLAASLVIRTMAEPLRISDSVRASLRRAAPGVPISGVMSLEQAIEQVHWVSGFFSQMFTNYALIALLIAALGAYGVIADSVSQRTREMGIRLALGARPGTLLRSVVAQGAGLGVLGVLIGLLAAVPATRFLGSMLYEVSATDPAVFAGVALLLVAVALLAAYIPARRAARVNPIEVLRFE